jgi:hypothetical protein
LRCYTTNTDQQGPAFDIDFNDELYESGDTVWYYFSARDVDGYTSYWSPNSGATSSQAEAQSKPMEVTCLPANAVNGMTDILYINGSYGCGVQPFFQTAFEYLGVTPDRFDVIDPTYNPAGSPANRVNNVLQQLVPVYKKIIYSTGYLRNVGIHDGNAFGFWGSTPDDFGMLYEFVDQSPNGPGLYLEGDNLASSWAVKTGSGAVDLRLSYMDFGVAAASHTAFGLPVSPLGIGFPGSCFDDPSNGADTLLVYGGGCSGVNEFDVLEPAGVAVVQMMYGGNPSHGAVVSQVTQNAVGDTARVILSGFNLRTIRNRRPGEPLARASYLADILRWLGNDVNDPIAVSQTAPCRNTLSQNFPNPFNPSTTILFTVRTRGDVDLAVYDVNGRRVRTLVAGERSPDDFQRVEWDGRNDAGQSVASGVYFYRLQTRDFSATRKMLLLR